MSTISPDLLRAARKWHDQDPDPETQGELARLLHEQESGSAEAADRLGGLFSARLTFGTAGIRGPLQPGPAGMNRVVVGQTTAGLAQFLLGSRQESTDAPLRVVVGCDARHNSAVFADDTAAILAGYGLEAVILPKELPTPVLAYAVRELDADAGVMVTASHNPPRDNGYKVYLGGPDEGSQIIPPVDSAIEALISEVAKTIAWSDIPRNQDAVVPAPDDIVDRYVEATVSSVAPDTSGASSATVVYTAMHGVGANTFYETVAAAGFPAVIPVAEQCEPDPDFPTVSFPNPEEKGALDLSFETAQRVGAAAIIAHDPDADRLAVALPVDGGFQALTGNQVGAILGWYCAERAQNSGQKGALANSLVSSPVLGKIATHFGLKHEETLTGFKYVSRVNNLIFGFEEALGYLVTPDVVRDKDGVSAGVMILDLVHSLAAESATLWDYLAKIETTVGGFASSQITITLNNDASQTPLPEKLRNNPPQGIGPQGIARAEDFLTGVEGFPPENILRYYLDDGSRIIVRPSGTEPKLKVYLDTQGVTRATAEAALVTLERDMRALIESL